VLREMSGGMAYLPERSSFFAGLADEIEDEAIPSDRPSLLVYTRPEPVASSRRSSHGTRRCC
jgi:hypothetical protein